MPMPRRACAAACAACLSWLWCGTPAGGVQPTTATATAPATTRRGDKPITTARGRLGNLLRKWHAEGTAAGNDGDYYDNRDRGHSGLRMSPYPQLRKITYTPAQLKRRLDWAAQRVLLPHVVFGNSSTSASVLRGGSNVRRYYTSPRGLAFLFAQYTHNNLYVYPEHRDHDPGHNGTPGYGDLYPTNTPYLIASQGSSGSDQPFMRAIPHALAAFRPEVKARLVRTGLLMPTLQMILRRTGKHLAGVTEYLTGKAHPTVFAGRNVDAMKMAEMAHQIKADDIPPVVLLKVVSEDEPVNGRDYFEPGRSERLADTPAVIARIVRGTDYRRKMVVSAESSIDLNKRPLTFHWAVLRGDAGRISIRPLNDAGSVAEVVVAYHRRRPVARGSAMESNRVDIGVFARNGTYYSPPAFVTFFTLDSEARTYDAEGRCLEIGCGAGTSLLSVADWTAFFAMLRPDTDSRPARLLKGQFTAGELAAIQKIAGGYKATHAAVVAAEEEQSRAAAERKKTAARLKSADKDCAAARDGQDKTPNVQAEADLAKAKARRDAARAARDKARAAHQAARKALDRAKRAEAKVLARKSPPLKVPLNDRVQRALDALMEDPELCVDNAEAIEAWHKAAGKAGKAAFADLRKRLIALGILADRKGLAVRPRPIRKGAAPVAERLTRYEKVMLKRLNAVALGELLFAGVVSASFKVNYVDPGIAAPKAWRDVYHYDARGNRTGWTRYDGQGVTEFNRDGLIVLDTDARGRCVKARTVEYECDRRRKDPPGRAIAPGQTYVRQVLGKQIVHYEYVGEDDRTGHVKGRRTVPVPKNP